MCLCVVQDVWKAQAASKHAISITVLCTVGPVLMPALLHDKACRCNSIQLSS
jgi:hypothetical protein